MRNIGIIFFAFFGALAAADGVPVLRVSGIFKIGPPFPGSLETVG